MLCYIAYPTSLKLQSANALQTYATLRELRARRPDTMAIIPRWLNESSRFHEVGVLHLPRPAIGKLSRLYRSKLWYYLEHSVFAWMTAAIVAARPVEAVYVRQVVCAAWWAGVFGPRLGIPVIYEVHDLESAHASRSREKWADGFLHLMDRVALTKSTAVVSLTEDFRSELRCISWRNPTEVAVIPDAYDERLFAPQDKAACRSKLAIDADTQLVVYAGMTFAHRWLDGLVEALAQLMPQQPKLQAALVGGRPQELHELQARITALGLQERVRLPGAVPQQDVVSWLGAADTLVIPDTVTDVTASPLKLFEYMALGSPLVLPDLVSLREIVPDALGYFFPRRNVTGLAQALSAALAEHDPQRAAERRRQAAPYTYGQRAEHILALVEQVKGK